MVNRSGPWLSPSSTTARSSFLGWTSAGWGGWGDSGLVRYDLERGEALEIPLGPDRAPGEAVFVPRSVDAAEDDGWYLMLVSNRTDGTSSLDVLSAADPAGGPVAQVQLPVRVPLGFHGNWVPLR